jgi:hypothetical protein
VPESSTALYTTIANVLRNDGHAWRPTSSSALTLYNGGDGMSADGKTFGVYGNNPFDFEDSLLFQTLSTHGPSLAQATPSGTTSTPYQRCRRKRRVSGAVVRLFATGETQETAAPNNADYEVTPSITTTSAGSYVFSPSQRRQILHHRNANSRFAGEFRRA